ncbi:WhiB family transcriptional regulator [Mycobacterium sp.]|uniref:WhiB family transcriptional regulator n=1 Tax=Mycobacterium sp. TaxID=1785 RepID=UPI002C9C4538|nr:WhiB family transcriptional regulator [Mycobacterium sp.]HME48749.1 WhiB family transcriptional regulator [Mycobacterium sp.]
MRVQPMPLADTDGLCSFDDPDLWFQHGTLAAAAKRICGNCPVRRACAQAALDLGVTDGVWAGVRLPGARFPEDLDRKRATLRRVVDGMAHEPEAHRRRTRAIRAALHHHYYLAPAPAGA